mgnify:CR=1 FL=1
MKYRYFLTVFILLFSISSFYCSKKDTTTTSDKKDNTDLVRKSGDNIFVTLKLKPKVGDTHSYKMLISQSASQVSEFTKNKEVSSIQDMEYYFTMKVSDINDEGVITYKVNYDSIKVKYSENNPDNPFELAYNSNIKDTVYSMQEFMTYNAMIGNEFKIRVTPLAEIKEVIEMDKIENRITKEFGDTLKSDEKSKIIEALKNQLKEVIQSQFQIFSNKELAKDSSWTFTQQSSVGSFPIENIMTYKVTDIQQQEDVTKVNITANLDFKVLEKNIKEQQITMSLENESGTGSGNVLFNLSNGTVEKKQYEKSLSSTIKMSVKGQSAQAKRKDSISYTLELIK